MSNETDNKGYRKPEHGDEDWHVPLNDNFDRIDRDVHDIERRLENGSGDGTTARFEEFVHGSTHAPVEGSIVEDHRSGSLDHWRGNTDPFDIVTGDTVTGEYSVHLDYPGGENTDPYHIGTESVTTRRGEVYSYFVRFDKIDERNQAGLTVCGEWGVEEGIKQGYLARIEESGTLRPLKWVNNEFLGSFGTVDIGESVKTGVRYRIEIELDWDETVVRVFNKNDDILVTTSFGDESETGGYLQSGGVGYGGRWGDGSSGEAVTLDYLTRKSLDASPARISGTSGTGSNGNIEVKGNGTSLAHVFCVEDNGDYEVYDWSGDGHYSGSNARAAIEAAVSAVPEHGLIRILGYYHIDRPMSFSKSFRIDGGGATTIYWDDDDEFYANYALAVFGDDVSSYDVTHMDYSEDISTMPILTLDSNASDIDPNDLVALSSDEYIPRWEGESGGSGENPGEMQIVYASGNDGNIPDHSDYDDLNEDQIQLFEGEEWHYDYSGSDVWIEHIRPVTVEIRGIRFESNEGYLGQRRGVLLRRNYRSRVVDCEFETVSERCLQITDSYAVKAERCDFFRAQQTGHGVSDGGSGYGFSVAGSSYSQCIDNKFYQCRHGVNHSISGRPAMSKGTLIHGCLFTTGHASQVDTHGSEWSWIISNNVFENRQDDAVQNGAQRCTIVGNEFKHMGDDSIYRDRGGSMISA